MLWKYQRPPQQIVVLYTVQHRILAAHCAVSFQSSKFEHELKGMKRLLGLQVDFEAHGY